MAGMLEVAHVQSEKRCTHCAEMKPLDEFTKHPTTRDRRGSWCKVCTRGAAARIRQEQPAYVRAQAKAWYSRNREQVQAASHARYAANRVELAEQERRRRAARKAAGIKERRSERSTAYKRRYTQEWQRTNADAVNAYHRAYYAIQPGKVRGWQHQRRARLRGNGGSYTEAEWQSLCEKFGHRCLGCGQQKPLTIDHVIPLVQGGPNTIENIQPLCKSCNSRKRHRMIDYRPPLEPGC